MLITCTLLLSLSSCNKDFQEVSPPETGTDFPFQFIDKPQVPVFEKGSETLPCCECLLWVKSERQTQTTGSLNQTWFVQAYEFDGCGATSILQVGGGTNPQYTATDTTWQTFPFSLATDESAIKLCAYVGSMVGGSNLPINIDAKITCEKAWAQEIPLTLTHSCDAAGAPPAPQACGNGLPVSATGEVDECGAYLLQNG